MEMFHDEILKIPRDHEENNFTAIYSHDAIMM